MMQKHMFGVTCPDELFMETAPGPTEHGNSALTITPTFYKNNFFCPNRSAYKNAYQIVVHMKNFPKINLV
jgi:hypothetical protein